MLNLPNPLEKEDDPLSDRALVKAMRKRILDEISARQAAGAVINNYGAAPGGHEPTSGVMGMLGGGGAGGGGGSGGEDPFDYLVNIEREDLPVNPETGKPKGWKKTVHRYRTPKEEKAAHRQHPAETSHDEFYNQLMGQVDPANYAGEGFTATEEIPRAGDVTDNPWVRGRVGREGEDWPGPKRRR